MNLKKTQLGKKGFEIGEGRVIVGTLVVLAITGAIGLLVLNNITTQAGFTGAAAGAIANITLSISNFFALMPVLGTVFGAVIILGAVAYIGYQAYDKMN